MLLNLNMRQHLFVKKKMMYIKSLNEYMDKQIIQANEDIENFKKVLNEEKDVEAKIFDKKDYEIF